MKNLFTFLVLATLAGCFQSYGEDEDLRAVPVTNNPHIIPSHGSGLPMSSGPQ